MKDSRDQQSELKIERARISRLIFYEISETELEVLTRGPANSLYLNFAIFLLKAYPKTPAAWKVI